MANTNSSLQEALDLVQMLEVLTEVIIHAPDEVSSLPFGGVHASLIRVREILQDEISEPETFHEVKQRIKPLPVD